MLMTKVVSGGVRELSEWCKVTTITPIHPGWGLLLEEHLKDEEISKLDPLPFAIVIGTRLTESPVLLALHNDDVCYITNSEGKTVDVIRSPKCESHKRQEKA